MYTIENEPNPRFYTYIYIEHEPNIYIYIFNALYWLWGKFSPHSAFDL